MIVTYRLIGSNPIINPKYIRRLYYVYVLWSVLVVEVSCLILLYSGFI